MDTTIFRKPETVFALTFEDVIGYCRKVLNPEDNPDYEGMNFICESFPKNSFMRVSPKGVFLLYHIRGDGEVIFGEKCIAGMRMVDSHWVATKDLDSVFCALNYDTGKPMELSEVRSIVAEEKKNNVYVPRHRNKFNNRKNYHRSYRPRNFEDSNKVDTTTTSENTESTNTVVSE